MTVNESRPGVKTGTAGNALLNAKDISAEFAHTFGRGYSASEINALNRRGLARLAEVWPAVLERLAQRFIQDAVASQLPGFWLAQAERLEAVGTQWADTAARDCRRQAWVCATSGASDDVLASIDDFLAVV